MHVKSNNSIVKILEEKTITTTKTIIGVGFININKEKTQDKLSEYKKNKHTENIIK